MNFSTDSQVYRVSFSVPIPFLRSSFQTYLHLLILQIFLILLLHLFQILILNLFHHLPVLMSIQKDILLCNLLLHPMSIPTYVSPTIHHISGSISKIHSSKAFSPIASPVLEISTNQHASLGARQINHVDRYGNWHYCLTAMACTLPPIPRKYEEAINFVHVKEWKAAKDAEFDALIANDTWKLRLLPQGHQPI